MEPDTNQCPEPTAQYADHIIHGGCILNLMQEQGFAVNYQRLIHFAGAFRLRQCPPLLCPLTWRACWRPALARWCRGQSSDWPRGRFISTRQKDETIWINVCSCQTPDQPTWDILGPTVHHKTPRTPSTRPNMTRHPSWKRISRLANLLCSKKPEVRCLLSFWNQAPSRTVGVIYEDMKLKYSEIHCVPSALRIVKYTAGCLEAWNPNQVFPSKPQTPAV